MEEKKCSLCTCLAQFNLNFHNDIYSVRCETCGQYNISDILFDLGVTEEAKDQAYILSGLARQASDAGTPITITQENISDLMQSVSIPKSPLEQMDLALLYISQRQKRSDEFVKPKETDYPLAFGRDASELDYFLKTLTGRRLLEEPESYRVSDPVPQYRLTPEGWEAVEHIRKSQRESNHAFVAMWFTDELKNAWDEGFKPALESTGFNPIRVDLIEHNLNIDDVIMTEIRRSGLMVAAFTGNRGGVYFEAGFAWGLGIPVIYTCKDIDFDKVHFDTEHFNYVIWKDPSDLRKRLEYRIANTIPGRMILR